MNKFKSKFSFNLELAGVFLIALLISFLLVNVLLENTVISLIISIIISSYTPKTYIAYINKKKNRKLIKQFGDFLNMLSTSLISGKNTYNSFESAYREIINLHGNDAIITIELKKILDAYKNGADLSSKLVEFGEKSNLEDIKNFAEVFTIGSKYGGNLSQIVYDTKKILIQKIKIEMDIERLVIQKKYELGIMISMPFFVIFAVKGFGGNIYGTSSIRVFISRLLVLVSIFISTKIGKKIIDIEQ